MASESASRWPLRGQDDGTKAAHAAPSPHHGLHHVAGWSAPAVQGRQPERNGCVRTHRGTRAAQGPAGEPGIRDRSRLCDQGPSALSRSCSRLRRRHRPDDGRLRRHRPLTNLFSPQSELFGQIMVRHMCATGEPSKPSPSSGSRKCRPMTSVKISGSIGSLFSKK